MLNQTEIQTFNESGFLVLPNFFKPWEISAWKEEVLNYYGSPKDYESWQRAMDTYSNMGVKIQYAPAPDNHTKMKMLCNSINNLIDWQGETELDACTPTANGSWNGACQPFLDYPTAYCSRMLLNTIFYLDDVTEYEGPFMYWKDSHHIAWEYFKNKPAEYSAQGYLRQGKTFESLANKMYSDPVPFYAKAGDLLIYHPLLLHSPSSNVSHKPRLALVGKWGEAIKQTDEPYYDFDKNMHQYWNFGSEKSTVDIL